VLLVLFIACLNVANLMAAQAAARGREMALRISIGAGRLRLVQLVLVESAMLALLATAAGGVFASWAAPFVAARINPPDNPARLILQADWRVIAFGVLSAFGVTLLLGLAPSLRASSIKPANALKSGDDPRWRSCWMNTLVGAQTAFCCLVLFVAGLLVGSFERLSTAPTGFSSERLLTLDTVTSAPQPPAFWDQVAEHLRSVPGVESVASAGWPLMSGAVSNSFVSIHGAPPTDVLTFFLNVSPGWVNIMKIPLLSGRDFRRGELEKGTAIVSQTFAKQYFNGEDPIGKSFETVDGTGKRIPFVIIGTAGDAHYYELRRAMAPVAYVPFPSQPRGATTFLVRTSGPDPLVLAPRLHAEVTRVRSEFRVSNVRTQQEINDSHTVRERLLAALAVFFAVVAVLLAGVGLYGVLDYSVLQRRREIGIRIAIGARAGDVAWRVTANVFAMVLAGAAAGLALGMGSARYATSLLYGVKPGDAITLAFPSLAILTVALLAALPAVIRAVRIDPAEALRAE